MLAKPPAPSKGKAGREERKKLKRYTEAATQYCRDVVRGEIRVCQSVQLACKRHLDDLARARSKDFEFKFDAVKAGRACAFIERFPHVKGKWARNGQLIQMEPWQCFIVCAIFGWVAKATGLRRFTEARVFVARKNAKTVIAAGIALKMFAADGEPGAEVYTGATNRDQAHILFNIAAKMARRAEAFKEWFGITIGKQSMFVLDEGSKFETVIGNPGDGPSPHCFIHDEFHEQPTFEQYETAQTGVMARDQALQLVISTSGFEIESPCHELWDELHQVLEGTLYNERLFGLAYTIDEPDRLVKNEEGEEVPYWTTADAVREANPNFGVSVLEDRILPAQRQAVQRTSRQNAFKVKHLNIWVNARTPWMNMEKWRACGDASLSIDEFLEDACIEGDDLGAMLDLTSRCRVFVRLVEGKRHYYVFGRHYVPLDRANDGEHSHYERWVLQNKIVGHPGPEIQLAMVQKEIEDDAARLNYARIGFDPHQALQMQQELTLRLGTDAAGENKVCNIPQRWMYLDPAMKETEAAVFSGRFHHDGDPVLAWAVGNVTVKPDANENIFPRKGTDSKNKIDPASALFNAMYLALAAKPVEYTRPYVMYV